MDRQAIRTELPSIVAAHVPKNQRKFTFRFYDGTPAQNAFGMNVDLKPFEGKVIAVTEVAIVVKSGRAEFAVIDLALASLRPEIGVNVLVTPYFRRDFQGERLDKPQRREEEPVDGEPRLTEVVIVIGGQKLVLPLPQIQCQFVTDMKGQLETLLAPDGFRTLANLLADAKASDFEIIDPDDENLIATPPEISCAVQTEKFVGRVALVYEAAADLYRIELREGSNVLFSVGDVDFTSVGATLERLLDDGKWRQIQIQTLTRPKAARQSGSRS